MKILITGGAGFVGSHLADKLINQGHEITVIDDLSTGRYQNVAHLEGEKNFRLIIDTVLNESLMEELIRETDGAFHNQPDADGACHMKHAVCFTNQLFHQRFIENRINNQDENSFRLQDARHFDSVRLRGRQ